MNVGRKINGSRVKLSLGRDSSWSSDWAYNEEERLSIVEGLLLNNIVPQLSPRMNKTVWLPFFFMCCVSSLCCRYFVLNNFSFFIIIVVCKCCWAAAPVVRIVYDRIVLLCEMFVHRKTKQKQQQQTVESASVTHAVLWNGFWVR